VGEIVRAKLILNDWWMKQISCKSFMKLKLGLTTCLFILGCLTSSCNYVSTEEPILDVVYDFADAVKDNQNEKAVSLLSGETRSKVGSQIVKPNSRLADIVSTFRGMVSRNAQIKAEILLLVN
jgi:hypothetical protein